jgi:hypothetical protein
MFTPERRDQVRARLLQLAAEDPAVTGAAITGSRAVGASDEWSDVDIAFGVRGELEPTIDRWTGRLYDELGALHHWDLPWGSTTYRVFLLPETLQVDVAFIPEADFGPGGPTWQTAFGETVEPPAQPPVDRGELIGVAWTMCLNARASIERGKPWQAEHMISGVRDHVIALACLREGLPARYGKGADRLPEEITEPLEATLVRSLDDGELRRALGTAVDALAEELERTDPELAARLRPTLDEVRSVASAPGSGRRTR